MLSTKTMLAASTPRGIVARMVEATRPYHHGNLRPVLLEHAERALVARGAGALSLREVAREAGVSHAAPRRHFPDKQALLDALALSGFERLGEALLAAIADADGDFASRLTAFARAYVRFATEHAALLELMFAVKHRPGGDGSLREAGDRAFAGPFALIAEGQAHGEVVAGEPGHVAMLTWATLHGIATMANTGMLEATALDDVVGAATERLLLGLRPR